VLGKGVRASLVLAGVQAGIVGWNMLMRALLGLRDDEDPNRDANRQFIIMPWRDGDGRVVTIGIQSAFADALRWVGMQNPVQDAKAVLAGEVAKVAEDSIVAPVNMVAGAVRPELGLAIAAFSGHQWFPDPVRGGRPIRDFGEYGANLLGLAPVYRAVTGDPRGGSALQEAWNLVGYTFDAGEASFYEAKRLAAQYQDETGRGGFRPSGQTLYQWLTGDEANARSLALNRFRMAIRRGDTETAKRWIASYFDHGGTPKGYLASARSSHPLSVIAAERRQAFMDSLDARERETVERAMRWHKDTWEAGGESPNNLAAEVLRERRAK
jgi:hypothetical protein